MRLNDVAAKAATAAGVRAATDVTGFGLAGHLHKLVLASGVEAHLEFDQIPLLPQTRELLGKGFVPGGTTRNLEFVDPFLEIAAPRVGETDTRLVVADPQTSGGLLLCVRPDRLDDLRAELLANGDLASVVGELAFGTPGRITIR